MTPRFPVGPPVSTFPTTSCALPHDLLRLLCEFAYGVAPKRHLFTDLEHVHAYQNAVPPLLLRKFVPRLAEIGVVGREDQLRYAESLLLNSYCPWNGFHCSMTEAFDTLGAVARANPDQNRLSLRIVSPSLIIMCAASFLTGPSWRYT